MTATSISFTDAGGVVVVTNTKPQPGDRFASWTPDVVPIGDADTGLGTGAIEFFPIRDDYLVSLELPAIPDTEYDKLLRLQTHLLDGYLVAIACDNVMAATFAICGLAPDTAPEIRMSDAPMLEYTFSAKLLAVNPATVPEDEMFYPPGGTPGDGSEDAPAARIAWTNDAEQLITFDASASTWVDPAVFYWDFGDGTTGTSTVPTIDHQYDLGHHLDLDVEGTNSWFWTVTRKFNATVYIVDTNGTSNVAPTPDTDFLGRVWDRKKPSEEYAEHNGGVTVREHRITVPVGSSYPFDYLTSKTNPAGTDDGDDAWVSLSSSGASITIGSGIGTGDYTLETRVTDFGNATSSSATLTVV